MPAGSDVPSAGRQADDPSLPRSYRPLGARIATAAAALAIVAMSFLWFMLPGEVQDDFTAFQRITLLAIFVVVLVILNGIFRTRARASERGLEVVNGYRRHQFEWGQIVRLSFSPDRPWALMDLDDGTTQAVMAIQSADGARAVRSARELAGLIARHAAPDSPG